MNFADRLLTSIQDKKNPTVMGLDPRIEYVPEALAEKRYSEAGKNLTGAALALLDFNKKLIDAVYDIVPAVKPQLAYYEMYGLEGIRTFKETVSYAKQKGLIVIADGKRNDIGSTAEAYAAAYLGKTSSDGNEETALPVWDCDAITVNPYLGTDGVQPFLKECGNKGIFILVKTSNPSSGEFQDIITEGGLLLYERVAEKVNEWGRAYIGKSGYSSVGAVVGATYPKQAAALRRIMPNALFLVPGYGAQGGKADDIVHSFDSNGLGAIVNASRSIMCAYRHDRWKSMYSPEQFAEAARAEAIRMRDEINRALENRNRK